MSSFNINTMASIIYDYAVEGLSMADIAADLGCRTSDISNALRPYHLSGAGNATGAYRSGRNRGAYKTFRMVDGSTGYVSYDMILDYVRSNYNSSRKETLDEYLGRPKFKISNITPAKVVAVVAVSALLMSPINPLDLISFEQKGAAQKNITEEIKDSITGKMGESLIESFFSDVKGNYDAEIKEYEGKEYLGNFTFGKPDGLNLRFDGGEDFTFGFFNKENLDGYGIIETEDYALMSNFKKNIADGFSVYKYDNKYYCAEFKKGMAKGYGVIMDNESLILVKFTDNAFPSNINAYEIIGKYDDSLKCWKKENGKTIDNNYKNINVLAKNNFVFDDKIDIFLYEDELTYTVDTFFMDLSNTETCISDDEDDYTDDGGIWMAYEKNVRVYGASHTVTKQGVKTNTFEANVS